LDGDGVTDAFYDTELNVTWLRNANANGTMNWKAAQVWASNLVVGGFSGWRLPLLVDTGALGCSAFDNSGGTDCGFNVQTKNLSVNSKLSSRAALHAAVGRRHGNTQAG
jgi:hypothetical protein